MNVIKLKGCWRCGGDLFLEHDSDGINIMCLQCSANYFKRLPPPPSINYKAKPRKVFAH